jgi:hypothetical protein
MNAQVLLPDDCKITWRFKDDTKELSADTDERVTISTDNGKAEFTMKKVTKKDAGKYSLNIESPYGATVGDWTVKVLGGYTVTRVWAYMFEHRYTSSGEECESERHEGDRSDDHVESTRR